MRKVCNTEGEAEACKSGQGGISLKEKRFQTID